MITVRVGGQPVLTDCCYVCLVYSELFNLSMCIYMYVILISLLAHIPYTIDFAVFITPPKEHEATSPQNVKHNTELFDHKSQNLKQNTKLPIHQLVEVVPTFRPLRTCMLMHWRAGRGGTTLHAGASGPKDSDLVIIPAMHSRLYQQLSRVTSAHM